jgi:hypothetical protein
LDHRRTRRVGAFGKPVEQDEGQALRSQGPGEREARRAGADDDDIGGGRQHRHVSSSDRVAVFGAPVPSAATPAGAISSEMAQRTSRRREIAGAMPTSMP